MGELTDDSGRVGSSGGGWRLPLALLLLWALGLRLAFAAVGLDELRFWDERYSLENVEASLASDRLEPVSGWYPVPSWTPHWLLLTAVDAGLQALGSDAAVVNDAGDITATGRYLCRAATALLAVAGLWVVWRLGRRLSGPAVGLLAAFLVSITPVHLRLSVTFKPDILLLLLGGLTVLVTLRALDAESRRIPSLLLAGLLVGLCASAKLNGVVYAVPLMALLADRRAGPSRWLELACAAVAAAIAFFLLNPWWRLYLEYFERTRRQYLETAGVRGEESGTAALTQNLELLLSPSFLGPWLGLLGGAGLLGLVAVRFRGRRHDPSSWLRLLVLLSFPVVYLGVFVLATPRSKPNHLLQLLPFLALGAAWLVVTAAGWWQRAFSVSGRSRLRATVAALAAVALAASPTLGVGRELAPGSWQRASERLAARLDPAALPQVCVAKDRRPESFTVVRHRERAVVVDFEEVGREPCLLFSDAVVEPVPRWRDTGAASREAEGEERVPGRGGPLGGPTLWLRHQGWRISGDWTVPLRADPGRAGRWSGPWPSSARGQVVSVALRLDWADAEEAELRVAGRNRTLHGTRARGWRDRRVTARWQADDVGRVELFLPTATTEEGMFGTPGFVRVVAWERTGADAEASDSGHLPSPSPRIGHSTSMNRLPPEQPLILALSAGEPVMSKRTAAVP